jgi:hypothetical protein
MMDETFLSKQTASDACPYYCWFIIIIIIVIELLSLKIEGDTPDVSTVLLILL